MGQGVTAHTPPKKMQESREAMTPANTKANPKTTGGFQCLRTPAEVPKEARYELINTLRTLSRHLREHKIAISELRSLNISNLSFSIQDKLLMTHSKPSLLSSWKTKASVPQMKSRMPITSNVALPIGQQCSSLKYLDWKGLDLLSMIAHLTVGDLFESNEERRPQIQLLALTQDSL
jgi:hypothetical protein